jgi:UDPglucose 6-dehydrogenase
MKIGIIGLGFVGSAVKNAYDLENIETLCVDPLKGYHTSINEVKLADAIFVCVPSPQLPSGECDISILTSVMDSLKDYKGVIISKVTAPPIVYKNLIDQYKNLVHAPEFLVAATAKEDYANGQFSIVGGNLEYTSKAMAVIKLGQTKIQKEKLCSIEEASLTKYSINCFLATKVIFMNQLKQIAEKSGVDYTSLSESIQLDTRLGSSHFKVPGPDGQYGFGGACFPKDTSALSYYAKLLNTDFSLLDKAININNEIRNKE